MVILDTDILIDHLRRPDKPTLIDKLVEEYPKETFAISIISIQELYEGQSTKVKNKERDVVSLASALKILPYGYETAKLAGEIARDLKKPIGFADSAIAATTVVNNAKLYTLNKKDFQKIGGLSLFQVGKPK